ncbi:MFS general substrate transporter [Gymnopus androsaceus JB14]|uniref:MFS general substrate transporter n=1 Tax=Gymnopus androsaceus JB14 TaxID=1447944 RepID=A0A6A4I9T9_9AGAR|nr:MFS general substrate transporter [Gymnopus androsaceus JB14]
MASYTPPSNDKAEIVMEEQANSTALAEEDPLPLEGTPERLLAERKLVRRLDTRVMPTIILIYIMNYIDRNAITTARLKGLEQDLHLSDLQYNVVLSILYVTYCPVQIPSNMMLNWIKRPSLYIGLCVVVWGLTSTMTGVTQSYGGILATRLCIGIPESAFYPGTIYLLSRWYTKKELAFRSAILYAGLMMSNAFGPVGHRKYKESLKAYQPPSSWPLVFLLIWRVNWVSVRGDGCFSLRPLKGFMMAIKDPKVWIFAIMNVAQLLGLSFVNFFPTLTATLGFNTTISLVLAAPPWILGAIVCCLNAWHADRTGERFFHQTLWWWGVMLGFIISLATTNTAARYVSMFLMACGYAGFAMTLVWVSNIFPRPPAKRAAVIGFVNGIGNLGNLMGSYTWKAEWGPGVYASYSLNKSKFITLSSLLDYHPSMGISFGSLAIATVLSLVLRQWVIRDNKKLDEDEKLAFGEANRARVEEAARLEGITFDQAMQRRKGFRYLY